MGAPVLSLVLPIFNEEATIPELDRRLRAFLCDVGSGVGDAWEVIFVNDGSKDRSLALLQQLAAAEPRYKVLSLARNFGHQMAITAGLHPADGEAGVGVGGDPPEPPPGGEEVGGGRGGGGGRGVWGGSRRPRGDPGQ